MKLNLGCTTSHRAAAPRIWRPFTGVNRQRSGALLRLAWSLTVVSGFWVVCVLLAVPARGDETSPVLEAGNAPDPAEVEFFELKIRPVLVKQCLACHGGDPDEVQGGLQLNSRDGLLAGGDGGPAIVAGEPARSRLLKAIRYDDDQLQMPPDDKLPAAVIADFEQWVRRGAVWPDADKTGGLDYAGHWAFLAVERPEPPEDPSGRSRTEIDRFIAAAHREHGLQSAEPADPFTLVRRAYLDLIGLPPTPKQIADFELQIADWKKRHPDQASASGAPAVPPSVFESLIDELLASPHYGKRWGRHWLDVARYADTAGDSADYPVPQARLYRDWVIDAFNDDMPYDQFLREQIAGDLHARDGPESLYAGRVIATGYLALSRRFSVGRLRDMHLTIGDTLDTIGRSMLGLTMSCARCHDHKYDPTTAADYYGLYGFFASTQYPFPGSESVKRPDTFAPLVPPGQRSQGKAAGEVPLAYSVQDSEPVDAAIQLTGDPSQTGEVVPRRLPRFLAAEPIEIPGGESGRRQLADWIASPENPLTARVMVNRIWQHHFGRGIVATSDNFGLRGARPTHPELLDYLASRFVAAGWSIKAMHRVIMGSAAYQQSAAYSSTAPEVDPANRYLWSYPRRRLDAEAIRDGMLWIGGKLNSERPGAHPFPPVNKWNYSQHRPFREVYPSAHRSVYLMTQRIQRHPYLALFDGPDTNNTTPQRHVSTVPLQALFLMNSEFVAEQAEGLARRVLAEAEDAQRRIVLAHLSAWSRPPGEDEIAAALDYVAQYEQAAAEQGVAEKDRTAGAWISLARVLLTSNEFMYLE